MEESILRPALLLGSIGFAAGFLGPMVLDPTSGNGPMLGIFITGPAGFVAGLAWGIVRRWRRRKAPDPVGPR